MRSHERLHGDSLILLILMLLSLSPVHTLSSATMEQVQFHLNQLESLLLPTQTTKMSLWTLEQDESFFKDTNKTSLNTILSTTLGISQVFKKGESTEAALVVVLAVVMVVVALVIALIGDVGALQGKDYSVSRVLVELLV